MSRRFRVTAVAAALCAVAQLPAVAAPAPFSLEWTARLRAEHVDDHAFARDAFAPTLRVRAGLRWRVGDAFDALLEGEGIAADDQRYDSTANRRHRFPVVADPSGAEINQAWLRWKAADGELVLGRQRLALDDQRWLGNVGWRQNEQTFDALAASWTPSAALTLRYLRLERVHRVNGDDAIDPRLRERDLDGHVVHAAWTRGRQRLVGYVLAVEDRDVASASLRTTGLRYTLAADAARARWGLLLEAARQEDHGNNPQAFDHAYWRAEPSLAFGALTVRAGWERLGGDGTHALQTPLATLHAFNGWADRFTTTPPAGLDDRYLAVEGTLARARARGALEWTIAWHDYDAAKGGAHYGRELDLSLAVPLAPGWRALVKRADYRADAFSRDVAKTWLQVEWTPVPAK